MDLGVSRFDCHGSFVHVDDEELALRVLTWWPIACPLAAIHTITIQRILFHWDDPEKPTELLIDQVDLDNNNLNHFDSCIVCIIH